MDIFWTGLVNVTTIINDDLQQNAVVAYFCRSASFATCDLIIHVLMLKPPTDIFGIKAP